MIYRIGSIPYDPNYLEHFGILGMKWGVRRYQNPDGSLTPAGRERYNRQMQKEASKDAKRYLKAKQYYGKGAGTRRKLLKGELSKKMKDPVYKKAFDDAVANGDLVKATNSAKRERVARDTAANVKKVIRIAAPIAILAAGVYYSSHKSEVDRFILKTLEKGISAAKNVGKGTSKGSMKIPKGATIDDILNQNWENINKWRNMR